MVSSKGSSCVRRDGDTLLLDIRLQPRASENRVVGIDNGRIRIRVSAAPVDDAANRKLIEVLAKEFGVAKSRVRLLAGAANRNKRVAVEDPRRRPAWLPGDS